MTYRGSAVGYLLAGITPFEQFYIQSYPFLTGPDREMNRRLRAKTKECWKRVDVPAEYLTLSATNLPGPLYGVDEGFVEDRKRRDPKDPFAWRLGFNDRVWKVNQIPRSANDILDIGCGTAIEIAVMRSLNFRSNIFAVDFYRDFTEETQQKYGFEFHAGHWLDYIGAHSNRFDVAFSNHCMEHLCNDPTEVLRGVHRALRPGGVYVFAMPIEMSSSNPYARVYDYLLNSPFYSLMLEAVDCAHGWKADLPELKWRIQEAGFERVEFFLRDGGLPFLSRPTVEDAFVAPAEDVPQLPASCMDPVLSAEPWSGRSATDWAYKVLFRMKQVVRIGYLKNHRTNEVLVRAHKAAR
jgi:SAM-dependent methyltransferase